MLANQEVIRGGARAPVEIKIDGFWPIWNEVVFTDFEGQAPRAPQAEGSDSETEAEDDFEPLLGYVILGLAQASVDLLGHWLVPVQYIDMK